jgi:indolepyruvate ferredoxin oxidoreductase beta subunit
MADQPPRAFSIVIAAMGGQGGGVLSRWIVDVAEHGGYVAQATSVPGVAQRTGATLYYIELFPKSAAEAAGKDPVLALMPIPGEVDLLIAAELVEAGRAVLRGLITPDRTFVVASSHRAYAIGEKAALGDGIADGAKILAGVEQAARRSVMFDMAEKAASSGSVISSVLLGAVAGVDRLPFERADFDAAIRRGGIAVESSLEGFAAGFAASDEVAGEAVPAASRASAAPAGSRGRALRERVSEVFPRDARPLVLEGVRRVADYQDLAYADTYVDRLEPILALDDGGADGSHRLTGEAARHLALWMSYEDAARVADLKTRSERFERMREEVAAESDQLVYPVEFMHPSVQELCDVLPAPLGRFIMERRVLRGAVDRVINRDRHLPTGKLRGFVLLYFVAGLRRLRRFSYRYQRETKLIDRWLARITDAAPAQYDLAVEIARCQRLIKGYGDTHSRGMSNFDAIMEALPALRTRDDAAAAVCRLSEAALTDEDGVALQAALADATL